MVATVIFRIQLCFAVLILTVVQLQGLLYPKMVGWAQTRKIERLMQPARFSQENSLGARPTVPHQARLYTTFLSSSPQRVEKTVIKRGTVTTSDTSEGKKRMQP